VFAVAALILLFVYVTDRIGVGPKMGKKSAGKERVLIEPLF